MFKPLDSVVMLSMLLNSNNITDYHKPTKGIEWDTTVKAVITIDKMYDLNKTIESILIKENQ
jgi:hypothetical protein